MNITFKGEEIALGNYQITVGDSFPLCDLTKTDLDPYALPHHQQKKTLLNIFPSIDTGVCLTSNKEFDQAATKYPHVLFLAISADLPFAHSRVCKQHNLQNMTYLSTMNSSHFGDSCGLTMLSGPLKGLLARTVIIIDEVNKVSYVEIVNEVTYEPNYDAALEKLL